MERLLIKDKSGDILEWKKGEGNGCGGCYYNELPYSCSGYSQHADELYKYLCWCMDSKQMLDIKSGCWKEIKA